jgi:hypothetical protein
MFLESVHTGDGVMSVITGIGTVVVCDVVVGCNGVVGCTGVVGCSGVHDGYEFVECSCECVVVEFVLIVVVVEQSKERVGGS